MATYKSLANRPWHDETEFEYRTRILVGDTDVDDIVSSVWQACRSDAEGEILANVIDVGTRRIRTMFNRVLGELAPQWGPVQSAGDLEYTVAIGDLVTSEASRMPYVWKNLKGSYEYRHNYEPLEYSADYSISGNTFTIFDANKGDRFTIEYEHNLATIPPLVKSLSVTMTAGKVISAKYGTEHARVQEWGKSYGSHVSRQLGLLSSGKLEIPEFASINLYSDWGEGREWVQSIPIGVV